MAEDDEIYQMPPPEQAKFAGLEWLAHPLTKKFQLVPVGSRYVFKNTGFEPTIQGPDYNQSKDYFYQNGPLSSGLQKAAAVQEAASIKERKRKDMERQKLLLEKLHPGIYKSFAEEREREKERFSERVARDSIGG